MNLRRFPCTATSLAALLVAAIAVGACSGAASRYDAIATRAGLSRQVVAGAPFLHVIHEVVGAAMGDAAGDRADGAVWVYIEGDGTPWIDSRVPADDPTPRTPVALPAMIAAGGPALLLGRPCYDGTIGVDARCDARWWTHRRFAPEVVDSMAEALRRALAGRGWSERPIRLVGFSGGGTIAVLLAGRLPRACAVITLAAPLDVEEWRLRHRYSALDGSLDPALAPPLRVAIGQLHLRGRDDDNVEPANGAAFFRRNPGAVERTLSGMGHGTEWVDRWPGLAGAAKAVGDCHAG